MQNHLQSTQASGWIFTAPLNSLCNMVVLSSSIRVGIHRLHVSTISPKLQLILCRLSKKVLLIAQTDLFISVYVVVLPVNDTVDKMAVVTTSKALHFDTYAFVCCHLSQNILLYPFNRLVFRAKGNILFSSDSGVNLHLSLSQ